MARPIVIYPNPVLETPCEVVTEFDGELKELAFDMFFAMYAADGVGLAANQLGVSKRVAVIDVDWSRDERRQIVLVNPVIVGTHGEQIAGEGCLSVPGVRELKSRPVTTTVRYQDVAGKSQTLVGTWLLSRAINHEVDHLNGKLCLSKHLCEEFAARASEKGG